MAGGKESGEERTQKKRGIGKRGAETGEQKTKTHVVGLQRPPSFDPVRFVSSLLHLLFPFQLDAGV